jgi:hypothetical protein
LFVKVVHDVIVLIPVPARQIQLASSSTITVS